MTWVNTEGRTQLGRAAVPPPGAAREDWKIVRALSEILGATLPYDGVGEMRDRMWDISPTLGRLDGVERSSTEVGASAISELKRSAAKSVGVKVEGQRTGNFGGVIENFYRTDAISRNSVTMSKCTKAFVEEYYPEGDREQNLPLASHA